ncbi:MAG: hypothetical protein RL616_1309 [Verrucomicrobiota bacterium]
MKIYCINLDRHAQRMERMKVCLQYLPFERIAAVDGQTFAGPDRRDKSVPPTAETLTRFERACLASHRLAWTRLLADGDAFACVLEDDLVFSAEFSDFIHDPSWIPAGCNLVKLETFYETVVVSRETVAARNRTLAELRSLHNGSGAYLISRRGAELLLAATATLAQPVDVALFAPENFRPLGPALQLIPALCVQAQHVAGEMAFAELKSSIQPGWMQKKKSVWQRVQKETLRPFQQLADASIRLIHLRLTGSRRLVVPHA